MKIPVTILSLWVAISVVTAQNAVTDSLLNRLQYEKTDTSRVMLYNNFAREYANATQLTSVSDRVNRYKTALHYADSGLVLAQNIGFRKGESELYRTCGAMYFFLGEYDQAIFCYNNAFDISSELNDEYSKAALMYNLAMIYRRQDKTIQALKHYFIAASSFEKLGKIQQLQMTTSFISEIYRSIEMYALSMEQAQKSLALASELNDTLRIASLYDIIAKNYLALYDTTSAITTYEKSIDLYHVKGNIMSETRVLFNYGTAVKTMPPDKRMNILNTARRLLEKHDPEHQNLAYIYAELGKSSETEDNSDSARYYYDKAVKQVLLSGHKPAIVEIYTDLGDYALYCERYREAEKYYHAAKKANRQIGAAKMEQRACAGLSAIYLHEGDEKRAFESLQQAIRLQDSIEAGNQKIHIEVLQMQHELKEYQEQQEAEWKARIDDQQKVLNRRRRMLISGIAGIVFLSMLLVKIIHNRRRTRNNNALLQEQHEEILQIQEELRQSNDELNVYKEYLEDMVRKQTAEQADKDMQLRNISNNLPGGFIFRKVTYPGGSEHISYVSNTVEQITGVPAEQMIKNKKPLLSYMIDPALIPEIEEKEQKSILTMEPLVFEHYFVKDNVPVWLYNYSLPHPAGNGSIIWDGFAINITKQKEVEKSLEEAKEKAEESDRLKSVFLSNMSHEIRTPMNAILGFVGFVENENLPLNKRKEYVRIVHESVTQLLQLIENIIDISKLEAQQVTMCATDFRPYELLKEIEDFWVQHLDNGNSLNIFFNNDEPGGQEIISNDQVRLKQVLNSLINNAIKYTDKGYICFGCKPADDPSEILFYVEDTGVGIPKNQHEVIFEHFRQGDNVEMNPKHGGTGLGLSISKGFVERMGGRIWVESVEGQGSTFFFIIKKKLDV